MQSFCLGLEVFGIVPGASASRRASTIETLRLVDSESLIFQIYCVALRRREGVQNREVRRLNDNGEAVLFASRLFRNYSLSNVANY